MDYPDRIDDDCLARLRGEGVSLRVKGKVVGCAGDDGALALSLAPSAPMGQAGEAAALAGWIDANAALLRKLGIEAWRDGPAVTVSVDPTRLREAATRGAGARPTIALADTAREALPEGSTYADAAAWMHALSAEDGAALLGCSRSSWYRLRKGLDAKAAASPGMDVKHLHD